MGTSCWVGWYNARFAAAASTTTATAFAWEMTRKAFASNPEAKIIYWWSRKVLNLPSFSCSSCLYHLVRCLLCVPLVTWLVIVYISYNAWIDGEHKFSPFSFHVQDKLTLERWRPLYRNLGRRIGLIYGVENSLNHSGLHQVTCVQGEEVVVVSDQNLWNVAEMRYVLNLLELWSGLCVRFGITFEFILTTAVCWCPLVS